MNTPHHSRIVLPAPSIFALVVLSILAFVPATQAQTTVTEGTSLADRFYNTDVGPTNSQFVLDFPITQSGTLENILTWGESTGQGGLSGVGQSFELFVLRPLDATNYQVVFATGYLTVAHVGTNAFAVSGAPFLLQTNDVIAHYGRGIPLSLGTGGPSSVYIAANMPSPVLGTTITVPGPVYPLYDDGGRNYAIQIQARTPSLVTTNADNGPGSLRQAVADAAALAGQTIINFTNTLSGQTITLTNGQIVLSNNVTIDASALTNPVQINGNAASRIFDVASGTVTFTGLILTNGTANLGGGIYVESAGSVVLNDCTVTGNSTSGDGGGVANRGILTINNCTLANNNCGSGGGGLENNGTATVKQSTFYGNSALGGGGIDNNFGPLLTIIQSTFSGNNAVPGGGIFVESGTLNMTNTIVSLNGGGDLSGAISSGVSNLVGRADINLAPPGNYGGRTPTMPPLTGSPAVDAGNDSAYDSSADQRGFSRRLGAHVDVGAVEGVYVTSLGSIGGVTRLGNGSITFGFTNVIDANFQVLATTNLALPTGSWTQIGFTTNNPAGSIHYQFTDPQPANYPQRYYRVMAR